MGCYISDPLKVDNGFSPGDLPEQGCHVTIRNVSEVWIFFVLSYQLLVGFSAPRLAIWEVKRCRDSEPTS